MYVLLVIVLLLMFFGAPQLGWHQYGYAPSGLLFVVLIILVVLVFSGRL